MSGLLAAGASLLGGILQSGAAGSAARRAANIAQAQLRMTKNVTQQARRDLEPWRTAGQNALASYMGETMPGGGPTAFQQTQDYQFGFDQGTDAVNAASALRNGPGLSGAQLSALNTFGQDYGSQRRGQWLNSLLGVAGMGQNAAAGQGAFSMNGLNAGMTAMDNRANALMAGSIGQANAWSDALGNAVGAWGYMKGMETQPAPYTASGQGYNAAQGGGQVFNPFR